ncbi:hypothetical protein DFA_06307 [Cavenderia fasciculata]|uniref:Uncharacterized protein n=1 Tax=Cavenderia fasciculata TaxID=261658 RepID=F4PKN7_CACFS|nr:uncharacterized protein DFA_06307 [Cavenderia fasciculata]EGG24161.1 hypothetical protein DFA_06307 [Cavenderia fasciculata]|eukprot:XP_004362012.1 hypothetical protein DFA_06307 [Cavenderia fasciculata]
MTSDSYLLKLSNVLLLHIISQIDDNEDIICLLLTCKQIYRNSSVRRLITFKGIGLITEKGDISQQFQATATRFNLNTFKDILENSISDQHVIFGEFNNNNNDNYPQWIQQRINIYRDSDKSNITTALVTNYQASSTLQLGSLFNNIDMWPSIETLSIINGTKQQRQEYTFYYNLISPVVDLGSIERLPRLERLSVYGVKEVKLGQHTTLKSLKLHVDPRCTLADLGLTRFVSLTDLSFKNQFVSIIESDLLPISLTSLTLRFSSSNKTPPRDIFHSLVSLVKLKIIFQNTLKEVEEEQEQAFIDLEHIPNLESFKFTDNNFHPSSRKYSFEIRVPPSIKTLIILSDWVCIPLQCVMPLLETLRVYGDILVDGRVSLLSSPSLKKLVIDQCKVIIPANFIPSTVESVRIYSYEKDVDILEQVVFPPSLSHLTVTGYCKSVNLPQSLVKLKVDAHKTSVSLPHCLKKLSYWGIDKSFDLMTFPSNYPPNLETIDLTHIHQNEFVIDNIPPSITNLLMPLAKSSDWLYGGPTIFSITSRLTKTVVSQQQQQWLPPSITHLTCRIWEFPSNYNSPKFVFRLDEVINHTNVRDLSIIITNSANQAPTYQFSIQRLDADNRNVLVLEKQTVTGGIITQRRIIKNNQQQQQDQHTQYYPIYLYLDTYSNSPYDLKWSFTKAKYNNNSEE